MQFYTKRTLSEQLKRLPRSTHDDYIRSQIDKIVLFDGTNQVDVTGYSEYSFMEEKSYVEQPTRANDGSINNIDDYETFLTPRLIVKYNMMNIEDYRSFMKMVKYHNGIWMRCYDIVEDKRVTHEMYVAPPSMPIIYQQYLIALGVSELSIELIGTNNTSYSSSSFTIYLPSGNAETYHFKKGYIWEEFINDNNDYIIKNNIVYKNNSPIYYDGFQVNSDDFIIYGGVYTVNEKT
jgi:hypothetical protein